MIRRLITRSTRSSPNSITVRLYIIPNQGSPRMAEMGHVVDRGAAGVPLDGRARRCRISVPTRRQPPRQRRRRPSCAQGSRQQTSCWPAAAAVAAVAVAVADERRAAAPQGSEHGARPSVSLPVLVLVAPPQNLARALSPHCPRSAAGRALSVLIDLGRPPPACRDRICGPVECWFLVEADRSNLSTAKPAAAASTASGRRIRPDSGAGSAIGPPRALCLACLASRQPPASIDARWILIAEEHTHASAGCFDVWASYISMEIWVYDVARPLMRARSARAWCCLLQG